MAVAAAGTAAADAPASDSKLSPGINTTPGDADDGWSPPPLVTLNDGSRIQLYKDGEALKAAYDAIKRARRRICLEVYIFADDATGRAFADLLIAKAKQGVRVYFIYDSFGCLGTDRDVFRRMQRAGVMAQEFNPIRPWECRYSWRPMNRDHRKLLLVDDDIAGMGGLNIADEYAGSWVAASDRPTEEYWRDTSIGIIGPSSRPLLRSFINAWQYTLHGGPIGRAQLSHGLDNLPALKRRVSQKIRRPHLPQELKRTENTANPVNASDFAVLASVPMINGPLRPMLHQLFRTAKQSIQLTMAYFAPDDELVAELCYAAKRGVKVQLMIPGRSDVHLLTIAARSFYELLMAAGVDIYERQTVVLHSKTMVIDGKISVVGSTNLDYRSIEYNCELTVVVHCQDLGQQMQRLFANDICYARHIHHHEWRRRPILDRFGQWIVSRARYLL